MNWQRRFVLGDKPYFENKERKESIVVTHRNQWEVEVNNNRIGSFPTESGAKECVLNYIKEHP